jgi:phosphatidylinositol glycan class W
MLVSGQNFQVISILTLAGSVSYDKNLILEDAFSQNMLGSFLLANILTGLVNLSVDTLSASSLAAFMILSVYTLMLCLIVGLAQFCGVRMKFW